MILAFLFLIPVAGNIIGLDMAQYVSPTQIYGRMLHLAERFLSLNIGFFSLDGNSDTSSFF